jgi:hypothetical protein
VKCPRCGALTVCRWRTQRWKQYFECPECWRAYELVTERKLLPCTMNRKAKYFGTVSTLVAGRTPLAILALALALAGCGHPKRMCFGVGGKEDLPEPRRGFGWVYELQNASVQENCFDEKPIVPAEDFHPTRPKDLDGYPAQEMLYWDNPRKFCIAPGYIFIRYPENQVGMIWQKAKIPIPGSDCFDEVRQADLSGNVNVGDDSFSAITNGTPEPSWQIIHPKNEKPTDASGWGWNCPSGFHTSWPGRDYSFVETEYDPPICAPDHKGKRPCGHDRQDFLGSTSLAHNRTGRRRSYVQRSWPAKESEGTWARR